MPCSKCGQAQAWRWIKGDGQRPRVPGQQDEAGDKSALAPPAVPFISFLPLHSLCPSFIKGNMATVCASLAKPTLLIAAASSSRSTRSRTVRVMAQNQERKASWFAQAAPQNARLSAATAHRVAKLQPWSCVQSVWMVSSSYTICLLTDVHPSACRLSLLPPSPPQR